MYQLSGKIQGLSQDFGTRRVTLTLSVSEEAVAKMLWDELHEAEKLSIKIDRYREKRSLNANNYAWKIMTEIGNVLRTSKDEVYLEMLKRYGQSEIISALAHIPIGEYVKYCEEAGESTLNGKLFKHYKVYKGSSEFDSREMSIFLDGVVSEAKEMGIPTETPDQIARLKSLWEAE
jgi:hypothetical protein